MTLARFHSQDSHSSIHTLNYSPNVPARFFSIFAYWHHCCL